MIGFKGLICNKNSNNISIGRLLLWITFIIICIGWFKLLNQETLSSADVPSSLINVFMFLLMYNLGSKLNRTIKNNIETKKENDKSEMI